MPKSIRVQVFCTRFCFEKSHVSYSLKFLSFTLAVLYIKELSACLATILNVSAQLE